MQNGSISNSEKQYSRKKVLYLLLLWGTLIFSGLIVLILYLAHVDELIISLVLFVLLVAVFIMLFHCKTRISFYDIQQRYQRLLSRRKGIEKTKCLFDDRWIDALALHGYKLETDQPNFAIYYKIKKSVVKKSFVQTNLLEVLCIVRDPNLDFYDQAIEAAFKKLWFRFEKDHHLNKQIILQFKKVAALDETTIENLNRIIAYKEGDNYLININCGYCPSTNSVYYLHSDQFHPNLYYKVAVETIEELLKY